MMEIRLIASDIDGTLLQNGAMEIPGEIFEQIHRLERRGILFCPASGRQYKSLRQLFAPVADKVPFLCENGAVVYGPGSPGPLLQDGPKPFGKLEENASHFGMGLYTSGLLCRKHGGELRLENRDGALAEASFGIK